MKKFFQPDVLMLIVVAALLAVFSAIHAEGQLDVVSGEVSCNECISNENN